MIFINALIAGILGAYAGKFLYITVKNLPAILLDEEEEKEPREVFGLFFNESICLKCNHIATFIDRLPILGRLLSQGKCRYCKKKLESQALYLEASMGVLFFLSTLVFGISTQVITVLIASWLLIACFITDFEHGILPDQFTLSLLWLGLISSIFPVFLEPKEAIIGAVFGYGVFWLFNLFYLWLRKMDGMFPGDFKLNAGLGALLGVKWLFAMVAVSMLLLIVFTIYQSIFLKGMSKWALLYKEAPYGCYSSLVAMVMLYLMLAGFIY